MEKKKQTAANNEFLKGVKKMMNAPIYKHTAQILNDTDENMALAYLRQFFRNPITREYFISKTGSWE